MADLQICAQVHEQVDDAHGDCHRTQRRIPTHPYVSYGQPHVSFTTIATVPRGTAAVRAVSAVPNYTGCLTAARHTGSAPPCVAAAALGARHSPNAAVVACGLLVAGLQHVCHP